MDKNAHVQFIQLLLLLFFLFFFGAFLGTLPFPFFFFPFLDFALLPFPFFFLSWTLPFFFSLNSWVVGVIFFFFLDMIFFNTLGVFFFFWVVCHFFFNWPSFFNKGVWVNLYKLTLFHLSTFSLITKQKWEKLNFFFILSIFHPQQFFILSLFHSSNQTNP